MKTDYSKEELLDICERALKNLHPDHMTDRDCPDAFEQVAKFYCALRFCDVDFEIRTKEEMGLQDWEHKRTIWIKYPFPDFDEIENLGETNFERVYLPRPERLTEAEAEEFGTWY